MVVSSSNNDTRSTSQSPHILVKRPAAVAPLDQLEPIGQKQPAREAAGMPQASARDSLKQAVDSACVWLAEYGKVSSRGVLLVSAVPAVGSWR